MLIKFGKIIFSMRNRLPYEELIIITSRSNLIFIVHAPFETTYFLFMPKKPLLIIFMSSNVSYENWSVSTSGGDQWTIPGTSSNPVRVSSKRSHLLSLINVPDCDLSISITDTQMLSSLRPCDWCDLIVHAFQFTKLTDTWIESVPNVDTLTKGNCQHVLLRPVNEV